MKNVVILGSTGTIGLNTLSVIRKFKDKFSVSLLVANKSWQLLREQIEEFKPSQAILTDYQSYKLLKSAIKKENLKTKISYGLDAVKDALEEKKDDIILSAFSGTAGILPTYWAVKNGSYVALANKESVVSAGSIIIKLAKKSKATIIPVDSEHSAIFQLLIGKSKKDIKKIILPASGGPFLNYGLAELNKISLNDALAHPVWNMGKKITIDSATLANKGLEVIEAHHLFGLDYDRIDVVIHPQCLIHGIVEMNDGAFFTHISEPDMKHPISYALFYPYRVSIDKASFSAMVSEIKILPVDVERFPFISLAYKVGRAGMSYPAVFNIADELAVNSFLNNQICFNDIFRIVSETIDNHKPFKIKDIGDIEDIENWVLDFVKNLIKKGRKK